MISFSLYIQPSVKADTATSRVNSWSEGETTRQAYANMKMYFFYRLKSKSSPLPLNSGTPSAERVHAPTQLPSSANPSGHSLGVSHCPNLSHTSNSRPHPRPSTTPDYRASATSPRSPLSALEIHHSDQSIASTMTCVPTG